jgi:ubiquinone/menaquinone biosynthesis C-methylase UbiE
MIEAGNQHEHGGGHGPERFSGLSGVVVAVVMLAGRGAVSRLVAGLGGVTSDDRVLDVGCGPGGAAREAARRGAGVTGVDPSPLMLRVARYLSGGQMGERITFLEGTAEKLPVPDQDVTVAWAISSAHHWADVPAGLRELHRVLRPGGRLLIVEQFSPTGTGHRGRHGFTGTRAAEVAAAAEAAGFADTKHETDKAGHRTIAVVSARRPGHSG